MSKFLTQFKLNREYDSFEDSRFIDDIQKVNGLITSLGEKCLHLAEKPPTAQVLLEILKDEEQAIRTAWNLKVFANLNCCVDGSDQVAKAHFSKMVELQSQFKEVAKPLYLFLAQMPQSLLDEFTKLEEGQPYLFDIELRREQAETLLSPEEEGLLEAMKRNGFLSWVQLYQDISSNLRFDMKFEEETKSISVAASAPYLCSRDESTRKQAYESLNSAWQQQEPVLAKALSSIVGWRLEEFKKRSHLRSMDYLEVPLRISRIKKSTLESLMTAVESDSAPAKKILRLKNRALGFGDTIHAWNLHAPPPLVGDSSTTKVSFDEGMELIQKALKPCHPYFAEFVGRMAENGQIDARLGEHRRPGAFCTSFPKTRRPHVFMSFSGEFHDVRTLAHELGHAFHNDVLGSLPFAQSSYPMTLAETASIFTETLVGDYLINNEANPQNVLNSMWTEVSVANNMMLGIPWRYHFEHRIYQERQTGALTAQRLEELSQEEFRKAYGNDIIEAPQHSWMKTLHFYLDQPYFYNFPYTFGYLFSLTILAQKEKWGDKFYDQYVALLQDTGRMRVEDLAEKYFGKDISKPQFWDESLTMVNKKVERFETKLGELGLT